MCVLYEQVLRRTRNVWQRVAVFDVRSGALDASLRRNGLTAVRSFSSLPDHEVIGLPALSPVRYPSIASISDVAPLL